MKTVNAIEYKTYEFMGDTVEVAEVMPVTY